MSDQNAILLIIVVSLLGGVSTYLLIRYNNRAKQRRLDAERLAQEQQRAWLEQELARRVKNKAIVESSYEDIASANLRFEKLLTFKEGYFNHNKLSVWTDSVHMLYEDLAEYEVETLDLAENIMLAVRKLKTNYDNGGSIRARYNQRFIEKELKECDVFFSNIEGQSLDHQQRLAVIKDEDNNLVIAGAGSGKTTTVAGKVSYVINRFKVSPEHILLITFTKKASEEMKHRIKHKMNIDIDVNTFHSFGRKVIGEATNNMPSVIEEKEFYSEMSKIFKYLLKDSVYASKVIKFLTEFRLEAKDYNEFKSHGEYINYLKDNNIRTYKTVEVVMKGKLTMLREQCKSLEEVQIANFLFLNGVNYKYEHPYQHKTSDNQYAQYKPDFYLPDYDIYIEHFGLIDKEGNVPNWFVSSGGLSAKDKYNAGISWKRETHLSFDTTLVETFSYENKEGVLLERLKEKLEARGVAFVLRTTEEIWEILSSIAKDEVSALDTLVNTFLNLFKSNNFEIGQLYSQIAAYKDHNVKARYLLFLDIFAPILLKYNEFLKSRNLIDFSDMINEAASYIRAKKFKHKYKYIIIDEFQDTSVGRFNLVNALLSTDRSCRLFAVGDDWQSIYRFAGSDISLFTQFEQHFGVTEVSKIETTYRFSKSMIDISSKFILANPNQTGKELKPFNVDTQQPLDIIVSENFRSDDPYPFIEALKKINGENFQSGKKVTVMALARYNHIIETYKGKSDLFSVKYDQNKRTYIISSLEVPGLEVQFLSVHRSKGLQADYVIILNCVSGQYGFPSEHADDPILNLLLSKADQFANGEERRLFYVALTRAKKKTFIITNQPYKSKFVEEIDSANSEQPQNKCPVCKEGNRIKKEGVGKTGRPYVKYSCSNWNLGCEYLAWD